jgi:polo-like kinase 1
MYTLLVGQPPFETKSLKDTYTKIRKCDYRLPSNLRKNAADMIISMLQSDPEKRPTIKQLFDFDFLSGPIPKSLPYSCLTTAPRPELLESNDKRRPLTEMNGGKISFDDALNILTETLDLYLDETHTNMSFLKNNLHDAITASGMMTASSQLQKTNLELLHQQLTELFAGKLKRHLNDLGDEFSDPASNPLFWVSKWVDYSDKYGFGYQLCDEGMGVMFNDTTKLIMLANGMYVLA